MFRSGKWSSAYTASLTRIESEPLDHFAWYIAGVSAHQLGQHEEALDKLEYAVGLCGDNVDYVNNLGVALTYAGRVQDAIAAYEKAIELAPERIDTLFNIAHALMQGDGSG